MIFPMRSCFFLLTLIVCLIFSESASAISGSAPSPADAVKQKVLENRESGGRSPAKGEITLYKGGPGQLGRIFGYENTVLSEESRNTFTWSWRYRAVTYELHYATPRDMARAVYGLALHSQDIDPKISLSRLSTVAQSSHYGMDQVCAWINDVFSGRFKSFSQDETLLIGFLIQDGLIRVERGKFITTGLVSNILAVAPGKKLPLAKNLEHERLHVFWKLSPAFRAEAERVWRSLSDEERESVRQQLKGYDGDAHILEEWAVLETEAGHLSPEKAENS